MNEKIKMGIETKIALQLYCFRNKVIDMLRINEMINASMINGFV